MTEMRRRAVQAQLSSFDDAAGTVRALVTTFGIPYAIGRKSTETIKRSTFEDGVVPIYFQHGHGEVPVGHAMNRATDAGNELDVQFYLDTERGLASYRAMKAGALKEWSVGFTASDSDITTTRSADGVTDETIEKGDLLEVSVVLRGANPNTKTLEVRSAEAAAADEAAKAAADAEAAEAALAARSAVLTALTARMGEPHIRAILREALPRG